MSNTVLNSCIKNCRQINIHTGEIVQMQTDWSNYKLCNSLYKTKSISANYLSNNFQGYWPISFLHFLLGTPDRTLCFWDVVGTGFFITIASSNFPFLQFSITPMKTVMTMLLCPRRKVCHIMAWWGLILKKSICALLKTIKAPKHDLDEL